MAIKTLLVMLLTAAVASANSCCRGYKILQYRRAGILPMYDGTCGNVYNPDDFCDGSMYPSDPIPKYEAPVGRYYPSYGEPKTVTHKCICSKSVAHQRMVTSVPRYYKRGYCSESLMDAPCGHYGQFGDCGQYGSCGQCGQCGQYGQCGACAMPPSLFRQPARVLPLTLPASCVC